jgi:hypothetical protein
MEQFTNPEEYLKNHLTSIESNPIKADHTTYVQSLTGPKEATRTEELQFITFDVTQLPCGRFYPPGTLLLVRPAQVREIQAYSTVDDNNFYDIVEKMNDMLSSCVKLKYSDGSMGPYTNIKDQDRLYIIFLIRELTFQKGNTLSVKVANEDKDDDNKIELVLSNFVCHQPDKDLEKYYDRRGFYHFELKNGKVFDFCPPSIGVQKDFTEYIIKMNSENKKPNLSFLKIVPFLLAGKNNVTQEEIAEYLTVFEDPLETDNNTFQFLNDGVSKMTFGIKELKKISKGGKELKAPMSFPNGASGIFVIYDSFKTFIKE